MSDKQGTTKQGSKWTEEEVAAKKETMSELCNMGMTAIEFCRIVGVTRDTFYRWRKEDENFRQKTDENGDYITKFAERSMMKKIKNEDKEQKSMQNTRWWLERRHAKFKNKMDLEVTGRDKPLTDEEADKIKNMEDI